LGSSPRYECRRQRVYRIEGDSLTLLMAIRLQ
jgi:hypothetical protein